MDDKKWLVPSIVIGLAIVLHAGALALTGKSQVSVSVAPQGSPVTVSPSLSTSPQGTPVVVTGNQSQSTPVESSFGSSAEKTTNWTAGSFSEDLGVFGTSTFWGYVSSTNVTGEAYKAYRSSGSSQTLCSILNSGNLPRVLNGVTLMYATSSRTYGGGASVPFSISLSATAGATGTGSNLLFYASTTIPTNGTNNITTTSTLSGTGGAPILWNVGTYLNFLTGTPTSTLVGDCRATYY